jgi:hypothetical protein
LLVKLQVGVDLGVEQHCWALGRELWWVQAQACTAFE